MKARILFFMFLFTAFVCVTSCSKEEQREEGGTMSLNGKSFVARGSTLTYTILGTTYKYTPYYVYRFFTNSDYEYSVRENSPNGKIRSTKSGSCIIEYPKITFRPYSSDETSTGYFVSKSAFRLGLYEYVQQ